jgi:hypothetical protein
MLCTAAFQGDADVPNGFNEDVALLCCRFHLTCIRHVVITNCKVKGKDIPVAGHGGS